MKKQKDTNSLSAAQRPLARRLISGASWATLSKVLTYPAGLILTVFLARLLSAEAMGGYFLATSLVAGCVALVQLGMGRALVKLIAKALAESMHGVARQVVRVGISTVLIFASVVAFAMVTLLGEPLLSMLEGGEYLRQSLLWICLMMIAMAMVELFTEILRGFHDLRGASLLVDQLLQRLVLVSVLCVFWVSGIQLSLDDVLRYSFYSAAVAVVAGALMIRANISVLGDGSENIPLIDIYKLGPPFLILRINFWLFNMAGIWVLGMYRPLEEVALYGAANIITSLVLASQTIMNGVGAPVIVELFHKQRLGLLENIIRSAGFFALLPALSLTLLLLFLGESVITLIYGSEYQQAANIMVVLAIGRCVAVFCGIPTTTLAMTNHQNLVMKTMLLLSALTLFAYFLLADRAGAFGVAVVTAVSIALQNLIMAFLVKHRLDVVTLPSVSPVMWQRFVQVLFKRNKTAE